MAKLTYLIEYKVCKKCQFKVVKFEDYCKKCLSMLDPSKKFIPYKSKKSMIFDNNENSYNFATFRIPRLNFNNYKVQKEYLLVTNFQFDQFQSLEHLTSYLICSNKFPLSCLIGELGWSIKRMPQIKRMIDSNLSLIPIATANIEDTSIFEVRETNGLELLYNPKFWTDLIRLYVVKQHPYLPIFNLKYFDLNLVPQALLVGIYCTGYSFWTKKSPELDHYMEQLAKRNISRVLFKPNISNLQALLLHCILFYSQCKVTEGRALLSHITRVSYLIGIHIQSGKFSSQVIYNRDLLYRKILFWQRNLNTVYKLVPSYELDVPKLIPNLYYDNWHELSKSTSAVLGLIENEVSVLSQLASLNVQYLDQSLLTLVFPVIKSQSDEEIEKMCWTRYNKLSKDFIKLSEEIKLLELRHSNCKKSSYLLQNLVDEKSLKIFYLDFYLVIFEFGRLNTSQLSTEFLDKTIEICDSILDMSFKSDLTEGAIEVSYLAGLTYMSMFTNLSEAKKLEIVSKLEILSKTFNDTLDKDNLFNYLIFNCGKKLINK
ncbi:hypothetical protein CONCODRAFT_10623 [Conidiobolus coronatus NRRL 28638]|uniref:Transcription factor domain-containing protein n=1 Tax=Conidiobolus coronatus (strain ATCC 28846 / CBS 209.66 / NRRL 28638) TaxID=796925 RepID=A0A137NXG0_CONC2|nr:hypothetical protein CONCODRAFT_10623 [Conidiobolus coronatus NRRL 28638]|eukprot:KXN67344.1 hypothetical protein CONCODRAFT_10623 [Conidiobolus coronatus NRRL 28638]